MLIIYEIVQAILRWYQFLDEYGVNILVIKNLIVANISLDIVTLINKTYHNESKKMFDIFKQSLFSVFSLFS